ncbi:MAG: cytochrome c family protein, partial [Pseudomonadota bacterium]
PCMSDCKDSVEITMRATVLDVTPEDETATVEAAVSEEDTRAMLIAAGEDAFRQCRSCHAVGENARNGTGPVLQGVFGRTIGTVDGFRYSGTLLSAGDAGQVWDAEMLTTFLADPRGTMEGTSMAFAGVRNAEDIEAIVAYLESLGE